MAAAGTPAGVIVVRVWHQDGGLVAKVLTTADIEDAAEKSAHYSSVADVCTAVREFLEDFERR